MNKQVVLLWLLLMLALLLTGCGHNDRLDPNPPACERVGKDCR